MIFAEAVIVFVGVAGSHHEVVERQLAPLLDHAGVNEMVIPAADLAAIVRHSDASRDAVKRLHVDGVFGGALITANGQQTFRFVIYDGKGNMRSLGETPLSSPKLSSSDLEIAASTSAKRCHRSKRRPRASRVTRHRCRCRCRLRPRRRHFLRAAHRLRQSHRKRPSRTSRNRPGSRVPMR